MRFSGVVAATLLVAGAAEAHTGAGGGAGFAAGLAHPFGGLDHTLALLGIGLLGYLMGGRAAWVLPCACLALVGIGVVLGASGAATASLEAGLAVSVVAAGGAILVARSMPLLMGVVLVGTFSLLHGFAHGAEMPASAAGLQYGLGLLSATAALQVLGVGAGLCAERCRINAARLGGAAVTLAGVSLLAGVLW